MRETFLIAGLGNPGKAYEKTRHNAGFIVVRRFAAKHRFGFRKSLKLKGSLARGAVGTRDLALLLPLTFMNQSGEAVALAMRYLQVELSRLLVVVDDAALPLGQLRLKTESGAGGHNGLKSVEEQLQTNRYARLRIGIGPGEGGELESHVLGRFSLEEEALLPAIWERAIRAVEIWLEKGMAHAMNVANV